MLALPSIALRLDVGVPVRGANPPIMVYTLVLFVVD